MNQSTLLGALGVVVLAVVLFALDHGQGRVCTKRDICSEDGTCDWRHCAGCRVVVHSDQKLRYDFHCRRGVPHGRGVFTLESGDVFSGNFRQGMMHGFGVYRWRNGDEYEGEWASDQMEGHGVLVATDGSRYEGSFHNGRIHGHGTFTWESGANYTGGFSDGVQHGDGVQHLADGSRYVGQFRDGLRHGHGHFEVIDAVGARKSVYRGEWRDGQRHGNGRYTLDDGSIIEGTFKADLVHGPAAIYRGDVVTRGEWARGKLLQHEDHS